MSYKTPAASLALKKYGSFDGGFIKFYYLCSMNILSGILSLFHKPSSRPIDVSISEMKEERQEHNALVRMPDEPILYTFYHLGPDFLTYKYPVDADPYKEIYDEAGIIGPDAYASYPDALQAMIDNDNEWFWDEEHEEALGLLKKDLLLLAEKYNMAGAYSLLGSIERHLDKRYKYWEKGAELGNKECMTDYAVSLYCNGRVTDGFRWLKKSADLGCSLAQMMVAISYNYGTLSEINLPMAAKYYLMATDDNTNFYKYLNLGVLLIDSGYYHTAMSMFLKMKESMRGHEEELRFYGNLDRYLSNIESLEHLLAFPYSERVRRLVIQAHTRRLDSAFCSKFTAPAPVTPEIADFVPEKWIPTSEQIDIDSRDMEECQQPPTQHKSDVDKHEDYLFLSIPVKIINPKIYGTQQELIFLEKNCHAELNKYIQEHLIPLRTLFKSIGYDFKYLPSHVTSLEEKIDILGSYQNDYGDEAIMKSTISEFKTYTEQEYWESLIPSQQLPNDCAGILRYVPNLDDKEDNTNYEYILFPYRSGTDWQRAFSEFVKFMHSKPIIPVYEKETPAGLLPSGSYLEITDSFYFIFKDSAGTALAYIDMPSLSKVLYLLLLNHPEGIVLKNMIDYHDELWEYYRKVAGNKAKVESIDVLCDPTNNSVNEKLSRIKSAFTKALSSKYKDEISSFIPQGKRGEPIIVGVERGRVKIF